MQNHWVSGTLIWDMVLKLQGLTMVPQQQVRMEDCGLAPASRFHWRGESQLVVGGTQACHTCLKSTLLIREFFQLRAHNQFATVQDRGEERRGEERRGEERRGEEG
ncbi:unnamed protein product [Pleuronectes platessa]|uniref:Uncharacterized protein n=1 Tax=Pleuronectes platessa TaxID=8262 RepID=A0A9N7V941_PLEPL|nr:unnamed protein product [Pleuronectes platessa]